MNRRLLLLLLTCLVAPLPARAADTPRTGKYRIWSKGFSNRPAIYLGYFVLEAGSYKAYLPGDKLTGEGKWSFDAGKQEIIWESGPYKGQWTGKFLVQREGKTHRITMKDPVTWATNSTDAP